MSKTPRRRSAALTILSTALVLALAGPAAAVTGTPSATAAAAAAAHGTTGVPVPAPTVHRPVGTSSAHLVDPSRTEPWRPDGTAARELMVTFWYPAVRAHGPRPPYLSPELSEIFYRTTEPSTVRVNAVTGARPAPGRHPLVLLSPGYGMSRTSLTALGEELAARGYAVAAVDHTHETWVQFPDGRVEGCLSCGHENEPDFGERSSRIRAADLRFVLDRITAPGGGPVRGLTVDASRVAAAGHSLGGAGSLEAMRQDPRIKAAANLDGTVFIPPGDAGGRPVLLFSAALGGSEAATRNWEDTWSPLTGPRYWVDLPAAGHLSFSDSHWVVDDLGLRDRYTPQELLEAFGTAAGDRALAATRAYLGAFLDRHLRGRAAPLLDRPSPAFPEVRFAK
ncbi:alpha/beta hydrolase family protein [Kitasatospora sp. NPDC056327]|uniref:alpha/beta hydrolase family protein n=1 Tax=Kitasatospora sp. NPDC056327 TaxID=3345785 RepID=UPI0035DD0300